MRRKRRRKKRRKRRRRKKDFKEKDKWVMTIVMRDNVGGGDGRGQWF